MYCQIEVIDNITRLCEFEGEWHGFLGVNAPSIPFQTPEWLFTWWSHFGSGRLHVLAFRVHGTLSGVVPGFIHDWNARRQLTLIGTGLTDCLDPVLDHRYSGAIVEALSSHLSDDIEWEICNWQDLSAGTPLAALGPLSEDTPCSHVSLPASFDAFLASRPKMLRRNLRRYSHKAEAAGRTRFEISRDARPDLLTALIELHGERWRTAGGAGMIASNHATGFIRDAATALARRDMLRFFTLRFQERIVAILMALCLGRIIFPYLSGFDPQYEIFGFGRELLARSFRFAIENGYREWNFLRGDEPYKFSWGAKLIPKRRLVLESPFSRRHGDYGIGAGDRTPAIRL